MCKRSCVLMLIVSVMISVVLTSCISALDRIILPSPRFVSIVEEGSPHSVIVIPQKATASEVTAASDLKEFLEKITGANIRIIDEHEVSERGAIVPFPATIPVYVGNCIASVPGRDKLSQ